MFCTPSETGDKVSAIKHVKVSPVIHYLLFLGGSFVVVLCCLFYVRVFVTFHLMCVHIIFSSVSVAEWPPFGK